MKTLREPVFGGAPDRVVRLRPDPCFDVAVQRLEPVLDDGFGLAGDLAPDPLAVRVESEADHSPPAAIASLASPASFGSAPALGTEPRSSGEVRRRKRSGSSGILASNSLMALAPHLRDCRAWTRSPPRRRRLRRGGLPRCGPPSPR